jgi:hypothetical protein
MITRGRYNSISLNAVCSGDVLFVNGAGDSIFLQTLGKS